MPGWWLLVEVEVASAGLESFPVFVRVSTCLVVPQRLVTDTALQEKHREIFSCDLEPTIQVFSFGLFPSSSEGRIICSISFFFACIIFMGTLARITRYS